MTDTNTIGFHIDNLREHLRQLSDDAVMEDLTIYRTMMDTRNLLVHRELDRNSFVDSDFYQTICVDLCLGHYSECCSQPTFGETLRKSILFLPKSLNHKTMELMRVTSYDGQIGFPRVDTENLYYNNFWGNKYFFPQHDVTNFGNGRRLVIYGDKEVNRVLVTAVFDDPSEAFLFNQCPEEDGQENCPSWKDAPFQIHSKYSLEFYERCKQSLSRLIQIPEDESNNAESSIQEI